MPHGPALTPTPLLFPQPQDGSISQRAEVMVQVSYLDPSEEAEDGDQGQWVSWASIARPGVQNRFIYGTQGRRKYLFCGFILALGQLLDLQNQPRR